MAFDGGFSLGYGLGMTQIKKYRELAGLTQKDLAARVNTSQPQIMRLERGERKLTREWAERLAPALGINAKALLFSDLEETAALPSPALVSQVHVRGEVQAGMWTEFDGFDEAEIDYVPTVPGRYSTLEQFAYRVVGSSMNKARFYNGDFVICVPYFMARSEITHDDFVVVERRRGNTIERTIKQVEVSPNGCTLHPRSDDPRFKPIPCIGPEADGTEVEIIGLAIGSFTPR